jgi:hypothetical protein
MRSSTKFLCLILIAALLSWGVPAGAVLNSFDTASVLEKGNKSATLGISGAEDIFSIFGKGRYGLSPGLEANGKFGYLHTDVSKSSDGIILGIGGKYRAAFFKNPSYPEVAITGNYDLGFGDGRVLHSLTGGILLSRTFNLRGHTFSLTPYGGVDLEVLGGSLNDDTDILFHLILGAEVPLNEHIYLTGELKIGGNPSIGLSGSYKF